MKIIVIPDTHGRTFWKKAVEKASENDFIVFLGDYLDPYPWERISRKEAIENFKEILEFKKQSSSNVVLLFGNHDLHYINDEYYGSRMDTVNWEEIHNIYVDNWHEFHLFASFVLSDKRYIFSHAGILKQWLEDCDYSVPTNDDELYALYNKLSTEFYNQDVELFDNLFKISNYRGGWHRHGSMVWADVHEHDDTPLYENVVQIFGHTQLQSEPVIGNYIADLDVRKAFVIYEDGQLTELD